MKKFPCEAFDYDGDTRLASEALLENRVNINDHDLRLHREIDQLRALARRMLSWQTQASKFLTPKEKIFIAEKVVYLERGRPPDFKFTATPPARREP